MTQAVNGHAHGALSDSAVAAADFGMAEHYLNHARAALEAGNKQEFEAARIMVLLALGFEIERVP